MESFEFLRKQSSLNSEVLPQNPNARIIPAGTFVFTTSQQGKGMLVRLEDDTVVIKVPSKTKGRKKLSRFSYVKRPRVGKYIDGHHDKNSQWVEGSWKYWYLDPNKSIETKNSNAKKFPKPRQQKVFQLA